MGKISKTTFTCDFCGRSIESERDESVVSFDEPRFLQDRKWLSISILDKNGWNAHQPQ